MRGWLIVAFDLPVGTRKQRKAATDFRNYLIDDGYQMIQFSVYARACVTFARQETHIDRLRKNLPPEGHVRAVFVTRAQWERSYKQSKASPATGGRSRRRCLSKFNCGRGAKAAQSVAYSHRFCPPRFWNQGKSSLTRATSKFLCAQPYPVFESRQLSTRYVESTDCATPAFGIKAKLHWPPAMAAVFV